ncbi:DUF4249 family protein [Mucilaginibacter corticis]|uniref:DUF4249 family protein n=1 Tax=Mucilaginibacter corticis TaxID=2597670 RepID=A0A556MTW5_9SPHI|nr:DUF4249 family protein [Mucilaginibacter corticis]TSJ43390.1 DUF4249 family protein [Mucilaginibacter corticis]
MEIRKYLPAIILPVFIAIAMLTACTKENTDNKTTSLPVIQSYLVPGQPISVKLSTQKALTDTATYGSPITGISLYLSDGSQKVQLTESTPGTYTYADQSFLVTGKTYSLQFTYQGNAVSASTVMPAKPVNFSSQYTGVTVTTGGGPGAASTVLNTFAWSNPDSLNHVLVFKAINATYAINSFGGTRPANSQTNTNRGSTYNVTENSFSYRGTYQIILFSVNQEYINLLNNNARTSSQNLTQIPTNIVNGFGIFTAMQADTLAFTVY